MLAKTRAIVLHHTKYGESKIFVDLFTEEFGRMSIACSTNKRSKSRGALNYFQPLSIIEIELDYKQNASLQKISDVRISTPFIDIPFNAHKLSLSLFLAEFLSYALREQQQDKQLYSFLAHSVQWLDHSMKGFANFHLVMLTHLTRFLGFEPNVEDFYPGAYFDMKEACFSPLMPAHTYIIKPAEATVIPLLVRMSYSTMHLFKMSRVERNMCTENILTYYKLHVAGFPELKSFDVLKELFNHSPHQTR